MSDPHTKSRKRARTEPSHPLLLAIASILERKGNQMIARGAAKTSISVWGCANRTVLERALETISRSGRTDLEDLTGRIKKEILRKLVHNASLDDCLKHIGKMTHDEKHDALHKNDLGVAFLTRAFVIYEHMIKLKIGIDHLLSTNVFHSTTVEAALRNAVHLLAYRGDRDDSIKHISFMCVSMGILDGVESVKDLAESLGFGKLAAYIGILPVAVPFIKALQQGDCKTMEHILDPLPKGVQEQVVNIEYEYDDDEISPLTFACAHGNSESVIFLIRRGADINAHDEDGKRPIYFAVDSQDCKTVESLIQANVDTWSKANHPMGFRTDLGTPIGYAVEKRNRYSKDSQAFKNAQSIVKMILGNAPSQTSA